VELGGFQTVGILALPSFGWALTKLPVIKPLINLTCGPSSSRQRWWWRRNIRDEKKNSTYANFVIRFVTTHLHQYINLFTTTHLQQYNNLFTTTHLQLFAMTHLQTNILSYLLQPICNNTGVAISLHCKNSWLFSHLTTG
jgi:hypothetical protein